MVEILVVFLMMLGLFAIQEVVRRAGRWSSICLFVVLPICLLPYWILINDLGVFPKVKLLSILIGVCFLNGIRQTSLSQHRQPFDCFECLFAINILEAAILDLQEPGLAHQLNAFAGLLLSISLPIASGKLRVDTSNGCTDLRDERVGRIWILGFSFWNWVFVYLNYPSLAGQQVAVVGAGLIVAMLDPSRWLQSRFHTLGVYLIVLTTFNSVMIPWFDASNWADPFWEKLAAGVALGVCVVAVANLWWPKVARKKRSDNRHLI